MPKEQDVLSLTRELIAFNTINPPGRELPCAEYLGRILEDAGFRIEYHSLAEERASLIATIEGHGDGLPLCFTGHTDTVPLGAVPWTRDPFGGQIEGDKLYGRGSTDMKGGLAAMIVAATRLARIANRKAGLTLVITASEENACRGSLHLTTLGGVLGNAGAVVVGEPTSNYPLIGHKGTLWIEARATGVTAHGSMPDQGVNAIYRIARAVGKLEKFRFDTAPHPVLGSPTLNVGTIVGGMNVNSVPDRATIGIDVRTVPGQSNREAFEQIRTLVGDEVELDCTVDVDGVWTDCENEWVQEVFDIMEPHIGQRPVARGATYFTDAAFLAPAYGNPPTIILGPGELEMAHKTDEYCHVSKIEAITEAYTQIARRWCGV
ncbi:MAG TPA: acetylornithine deacetylase [Planctomycetaceae bacterium]|nr:acetylornithine deacetylase [Planctomycetaceae bacterium]